jgi:hypothetical protein
VLVLDLYRLPASSDLVANVRTLMQLNPESQSSNRLGGCPRYAPRPSACVDVYERRLTATGWRGTRASIHLTISARGLAALEVRCCTSTLAQALPMHGRMIHSITNESSFRP